MTKLLGRTHDELLGKELFEIGLLKDEAASRAAFEDLRRTGVLRYDNLPLKDKAGNSHAVEVVSNRYDEDGESIIQCNVRDITERKQVEARLRESEERNRLIVEGATGFALIMLDPEGHVATWNTGAERLLRYREAEILGENFSRFFTSEDLAEGRPRRELETAARNEEGPDDNWLVRKDGSRFWASGATTALRDEAGALRGFTKVVRDTTERKLAEDALAQSHTRLQTHADELSRFNRVAVGREVRMIDLKKEINELCARLGEAARYPLEFEREGTDGES
jgi:PAS domain S-box-containing protein